ncbi:MAG: zinc ribbon-containing protein, partial [Gammaproteobacteria bacterium]
KEKAVELGELSREEAERIGDYLRRDLEDAGEYLADTGSELSSWLHFDVELVEDRLWEAFTAAADQTKLAYLELAQRAQRASEFHTGEVTTVGTLRCSSCGELLHFHGTGHIPPCPKCHSTRFTRPRKRA